MMSEEKKICDISYTKQSSTLNNGETHVAPIVDICNNNNSTHPREKSSGIGDTPDLISDESPPTAMLEISSDSDLFYFEANVSVVPRKGEGTETVDNSLRSSRESSSTALPITAENDSASQREAALTIAANETEYSRESSVSPISSGITLNFGAPNSNPLVFTNDKKTIPSPIPSSHQIKMTTFDDNQNGEKFSFMVQAEQGNDSKTNSLTLCSANGEVHFDSTNTYQMEDILVQLQHVVKGEDEVPSSTSSEKEGDTDTNNSPSESGAVTAPDVKHRADADSRLVSETVSTSSMNKNYTSSASNTSVQLCETGGAVSTSIPANITAKSINFHKSYDACELLLQQQEHLKSSLPISENEDSKNSPDAIVAKHVNSSSRSSSEKKNLSCGIIASKKVEKECNNSRRSKSKQTSHHVTRNVAKSPVRVEVYDRNIPLAMKQPKSGKPTSPYLCKIFPLTDVEKIDKRVAPNLKVNLSIRQGHILDKELARGIEREKQSLVEAFTEYYNSNHKTNTGSPSCTRHICVEEDPIPIIANGSPRETSMSWLVREKHSESIEDSINQSENCWNPLANKFRRNMFTQVSSRPSFTEKAAQVASNDSILSSEQKSTSSSSKIWLVGEEKKTDILDACQSMFKSLKSLQSAIHLSDIFCFRNSAPELHLGESLSQPEFQKFMQSENEIEFLANVMILLRNAKENVGMYLNSLQKANLVTGDDMTKIEILNANELNGNKDKEDNYEKKSDLQQNSIIETKSIVPFTCPSCHSEMDLEVSNSRRSDGICGDRVLPIVYAILAEQGKITMNTYYTPESKSLAQTVLCDGHMYQIHFSAVDPSGPIQGITKAKNEYLGQPSYLSLEILLSIIHRCSSYIDTRIACSCVWIRQSKRYLLELIERYLEKRYRPSTDLSRWKLRRMERSLKKINVFAGIFRDFTGELIEAVNKLHFCMQKSRILLSKNLKKPDMPGFSFDSTSSSWEDVNREIRSVGMYFRPRCSFPEYYEVNLTSSVEQLYEKLHAPSNGNDLSGEDISMQVLLKIVALAVKDIEKVSDLGEHYKGAVKMPGKKGRRAFRFMITTVSQLGLTKDMQFGTLMTTFLSAVDKLSFFEEFMCEQKTEIRANVHQMCLKIIRKFYDLRANLCMQMNWSINLAKNSYMRIREINEIKRIRKLKKVDRHINEKIEFLRGSDGSLRASVC